MFTNSHTNNIEVDKVIFQENNPFPHIVLDGFINGPIKNVVHEVENIANDQYDFNEHQNVQIKKRGLSDQSKMPEIVRNLVCYFQSKDMISYLEQLTGISDLLPDPSLLGGGIHKTVSGGHLAVHADFNIHPELGLHRRVNLLLFLNPYWLDEWGGHLELWDQSMTQCCKKILPILNRAVIFKITDDAYHGHPDPLKCPDNFARYSLAFYYYTKDRPENEKSSFHWATWKMRPNGTF